MGDLHGPRVPGPPPGPGTGSYPGPGTGPYSGTVPRSGPGPAAGPDGADPHAGGPPPQLLAGGRDTPTAAERLRALPPRARALLLAGALLAAAAAGHALHHDRPAPAPPAAAPHRPARPPYPQQATDIVATYVGIDAGERTFTVKLRASARSPVEVLGVAQGYDALEVTLIEQPPVGVAPGLPRALTLRGRVTDCGKVPYDARMPVLDVTLRNGRARQTVGVIPGDRYARDLSRTLHTLCHHGRS